MKRSAYSTAKLRKRLKALETENAQLRKMLTNSDKSPDRALSLLKGIVLSSANTREGEIEMMNAMEEATVYLTSASRSPIRMLNSVQKSLLPLGL